jgi:hypothetical protein
MDALTPETVPGPLPANSGDSLSSFSLNDRDRIPPNHLQPEALLRMRITHSRGFDQPAGPLEMETLDAIEKQIQAPGVKSTRGPFAV